MATLKPETPEQAAEAVAWALAEEAALEVMGRGTKRALGRPMKAGNILDLSALRGITLYEPEELVLSARAGTSLAEIEAALAEKNQMLAFEPADLGPLLGGKAGAGSIGGVLACNLAGPRRIKAGAARDHFLGTQAVSGRGEIFKSGGRVVKNVTGYDLCKLMAGSYGTLAAMTDVTVKVLPAPEKTRTVLLYGLEDAAALGALSQALQSSHEVSGAAHMPADISGGSAVSYVAKAGAAVTAIRVEGPGPSVEHRAAALRRDLGAMAETEELHGMNSAKFWTEVRDLRPFAGDSESLVWKISVPPAAGAQVMARIAPGSDARHYYDWGGGLIWLALPPGAVREAEVRAALKACGGHATLIRAPEDMRKRVPVFQPQEPGLAALTARVKAGFDPNRILNPGRMVAGV